MKIIYMECTLILMSQDPQNTGKIQELMGSFQHCAIDEDRIKYLKLESE